MSRILLYPYNIGSISAKLVSKAIEEKGITSFRIREQNSRYRPRNGDIIVGWGNPRAPSWHNPLNRNIKFLNHWENIPNAIDKKRTFARLKATDVSCVDVTVDEAVARQWLTEGHTVVGRKSLSAHAGIGIVFITTPEEFVRCPLYTKYKKKKKEFRVHVFKDQVIDFQEKRRASGATVNSQIRTHENGWRFCREGAVLPNDAAEICCKAVRCLGLDFGGVDLIWNESENKSYVLEVNSAPGIEGTTVTAYANAIAAQ